MSRVAEEHQSLWILAASPAIWSAHFMVSYITAAIWCGRIVGPDASFGTLRLAIGGYTVAALAGIVIIGWIGLRNHRSGDAALPHDADTPEDRRRFLGFATLLLSSLSAVATLYSALAAVFIQSCD